MMPTSPKEGLRDGNGTWQKEGEGHKRSPGRSLDLVTVIDEEAANLYSYLCPKWERASDTFWALGECKPNKRRTSSFAIVNQQVYRPHIHAAFRFLLLQSAVAGSNLILNRHCKTLSHLHSMLSNDINEKVKDDEEHVILFFAYMLLLFIAIYCRAQQKWLVHSS